MNSVIDPVSSATITNATSTVSILHSRAVLFRLFTSAFIGNPQDKTLTSEVENSHNISTQKRISVRKKIMQGSELNAVSAALQRVRLLSEQLSAPWLDGGLRIVASKSLIDAKRKIETAIREFEATVDHFIDNYDQIIDRDRVALNGTFRLSDYPSKFALRAKFSARLEIFPLPSADFRVEGIADSVCEEIAAQMEANTLARISDAKRDLVSRVRDRVATLTDKLKGMGEKSRLHDSTLSNVIDTCAEVKAANFDADPALDRLSDSIAGTISLLSADAIRDNEGAKDEAIKTAQSALDEINEAMKGFAL